MTNIAEMTITLVQLKLLMVGFPVTTRYRIKTYVPPQNSTGVLIAPSPSGFLSKSSTRTPTLTTRTGSGYACNINKGFVDEVTRKEIRNNFELEICNDGMTYFFENSTKSLHSSCFLQRSFFGIHRLLRVNNPLRNFFSHFDLKIT